LLYNALQEGNSIPKWLPRARVGIHLGKSLKHARNVALVLNPHTGMVSAQYHVKVDDTLETIRGLRESIHGMWKEKCGLGNESTRKNLAKGSKGTRTKTSNSVDSTTNDLVQENIEIRGQVDQVQEEEFEVPQDFGNGEIPAHKGEGIPAPEEVEALSDNNTVRRSYCT
jgi:hypothetical protein